MTMSQFPFWAVAQHPLPAETTADQQACLMKRRRKLLSSQARAKVHDRFPVSDLSPLSSVPFRALPRQAAPLESMVEMVRRSGAQILSSVYPALMVRALELSPPLVSLSFSRQHF